MLESIVVDTRLSYRHLFTNLIEKRLASFAEPIVLQYLVHFAVRLKACVRFDPVSQALEDLVRTDIQLRFVQVLVQWWMRHSTYDCIVPRVRNWVDSLKSTDYPKVMMLSFRARNCRLIALAFLSFESSNVWYMRPTIPFRTLREDPKVWM